MWEWVLGEMVSPCCSPNLLMQRVRQQIPQCWSSNNSRDFLPVIIWCSFIPLLLPLHFSSEQTTKGRSGVLGMQAGVSQLSPSSRNILTWGSNGVVPEGFEQMHAFPIKGNICWSLIMKAVQQGGASAEYFGQQLEVEVSWFETPVPSPLNLTSSQHRTREK